jgi:hypothetical protein
MSIRINKYLAGCVFALLLMLVAYPAKADAGAFLRGMEGSYRGSGTAKIPGRDKLENVSCRVSNSYDGNTNILAITGNCATTQAKNVVRGELKHDGNNVTGSLIGAVDGLSLTKSSGTLNGNQLVVSSSFVSNNTGRLTRSRQIISRTGSGFNTQFYTFDNKSGSFIKAGSINFTSR